MMATGQNEGGWQLRCGRMGGGGIQITGAIDWGNKVGLPDKVLNSVCPDSFSNRELALSNLKEQKSTPRFEALFAIVGLTGCDVSFMRRPMKRRSVTTIKPTIRYARGVEGVPINVIYLNFSSIFFLPLLADS